MNFEIPCLDTYQRSLILEKKIFFNKKYLQTSPVFLFSLQNFLTERLYFYRSHETFRVSTRGLQSWRYARYGKCIQVATFRLLQKLLLGKSTGSRVLNCPCSRHPPVCLSARVRDTRSFLSLIFFAFSGEEFLFPLASASQQLHRGCFFEKTGRRKRPQRGRRWCPSSRISCSNICQGGLFFTVSMIINPTYEFFHLCD